MRSRRFTSAQRGLKKIIEEFKLLWKNYLYQSFIAGLVVFAVLQLLTTEHVVIIASIGSTAFIVFAMPRNITAEPRRVIGGHLVGLLSGSLAAFIPQPSVLSSIIVYSFAVAISMFLMVATDTEHPPASGTALGVAITGFSLNIAIAILTSTIVLSLAHRFLKKFLKDLT